MDSHFERFAEAVWVSLTPAASEHKPEWIALPGGGSCITRLSQKIRQRIQAAGCKVASFGQSGTNKPPEARANDGFAPWSETDAELTRLATALGATSVILDFPSFSLCHTHRDWIAEQAAERLAVEPDDVQCECNGMNPDCSICGGLGYHARH